MQRPNLLLLTTLLSFAGIADSFYLAEHALTNTALSCGIGAISGCNIVAQSSYSHFFGIPLGVYGMVFYSLMFLGVIMAQRIKTPLFMNGLFGISVLGLFLSVYFVWLQFFVINAICIYCMGSFLLSVGIFIGIFLLRRTRQVPLAVVM